jgi:hypothetical protein
MIAPHAVFCAAPSAFITSAGNPKWSYQPDVHKPAWFNDPTNWGSGLAQIGAGTTVLLCGAFIDATPSDTLLKVQGSGYFRDPTRVEIVP